MPSKSDIITLLEECVSEPTDCDVAEYRSELLKILSLAQGRFVPPTACIAKEDVFPFDCDSDDDNDDSVLADLEELMERNERGDFALVQQAQGRKVVSFSMDPDFTESTVNSCSSNNE